jgi:hypothetical protein
VNATAIARASGLIWLALASGACGDPLVSIERIASLRALAARVEVEGDPDRAAPLPGESARVDFLVAAPELAPSFGFGLVVCEASPGEAGTPTCAGEPFASVYTEPAAESPSLDFIVPAAIAADARVAVLGVLCEGEAPRGDSIPPLCESENAEHRLSLGFSLPGEYEPNRNPNFSDESIALDGEALLALDAVDGACSGLGFTEVARGSDHTFTLTLAEDAREVLPETDGVGPELEGLQLSHFATDGELDRAFSYVAAERAELSASVGWKAPGNPAEGGTLVRFFFVVRDFRGGSAFTERALCVIP